MMTGTNESELIAVHDALAAGMSLSIKTGPKSQLDGVAALLDGTAKQAEDWEGTAPARMRDDATTRMVRRLSFSWRRFWLSGVIC